MKKVISGYIKKIMNLTGNKENKESENSSSLRLGSNIYRLKISKHTQRYFGQDIYLKIYFLFFSRHVFVKKYKNSK